MLKKLSMLLLLCALCMWAADFWTTKPFTEWSDKEVAKILSNSPWAEKVTIAGGLGRGGVAESPNRPAAAVAGVAAAVAAGVAAVLRATLQAPIPVLTEAVEAALEAVEARAESK